MKCCVCKDYFSGTSGVDICGGCIGQIRLAVVDKNYGDARRAAKAWASANARPEAPPRRRKVVQIAVDPSAGYHNVPRKYAICDDGTMWMEAGGEWGPLPDVPQDEVVEDTYRMIAHHRARLLSAVLRFTKAWQNRPEMQYDQDFEALKAALDGEEGS